MESQYCTPVAVSASFEDGETLTSRTRSRSSIADDDIALTSYCSCSLCCKAYYAHKRIYFDADSEQWIKRRDIEDEINWDEIDFDATDVNSPIGSKSQQSEHTDPPPIIDFFSEAMDGLAPASGKYLLSPCTLA